MDTGVKMKKNESFLKRIKESSLSGIILFLIIICIVLGIVTPNFLTIYNAKVILLSAMITAVVGFSQMTIIATGGMNLSVGYIGGLSAIFCASAMQNWGFATVPAILTGLAVGAAAGMVNGLLIAGLGGSGIMSFLITLATSFAFQGIMQGYSQANTYNSLNQDFNNIGSAEVLGIPVLAIVMVAIAFLLWFMFKYLGVGRQILAFGANSQAATLYGVNAKKTIVISHTLSGLLAACAGIMLSARMSAATIDIGSDWMLFSFAAPIIGGTRQAGGKVNVWGAMIGAIILSTILNGIVHLNISVYWNQFIEGIVILLAIVVDTIRDSEKKNKGIEI